MRILHVIPSIGPLRGGPSFALPLMARHLALGGVEVHIATTDDNGPAARLDVPLASPVRADGYTTWFFPRQVRFYTASLPLARWLLCRTREFDAVHIHALFSFAALPAAIAATRAGIPYIVRPLGTLNRWGMEQRRPLLKEWSFRLVERRILEGAAAIHYTSEQERDEAALLGVPDRGVIVPLGLDLSQFETLPDRAVFERAFPQLAGKRMILYMSRLDPKKGLDLLLPAFADVLRLHPEAALCMAGSGNEAYVAELQEMAASLGIGNAILWPGFLAGEEKLAALARADLFVLPSYSENFGVAVVEAMAAGVPVVLTSGVAVAADIARTGAGVVVPCEVSALGRALVTVLSDGARAAELGRRARRTAEHSFSIERTAGALLDLYRAVTGAETAYTVTALT